MRSVKSVIIAVFAMLVVSLQGADSRLSNEYLAKFIDAQIDRINEEVKYDENVERDFDENDELITRKEKVDSGYVIQYTPTTCSGSGIVKCVIKDIGLLATQDRADVKAGGRIFSLKNVIIELDLNDLKHTTYSVLVRNIVYDFAKNVNKVEAEEIKKYGPYIMPRAVEMRGSGDYKKRNNAFSTFHILLKMDKLSLESEYAGDFDSIFLGNDFADSLLLYETQIKILDSIKEVNVEKEKINIIKNLIDFSVKNFTLKFKGDLAGIADIIAATYSKDSEPSTTKEQWLANIAMAKYFVNMPPEGYPAELNALKNAPVRLKVINLANGALDSVTNVINGSKDSITLNLKSKKEPTPYAIATISAWADKADYKGLSDDESAKLILQSLNDFFAQYDLKLEN